MKALLITAVLFGSTLGLATGTHADVRVLGEDYTSQLFGGADPCNEFKDAQDPCDKVGCPDGASNGICKKYPQEQACFYYTEKSVNKCVAKDANDPKQHCSKHVGDIGCGSFATTAFRPGQTGCGAGACTSTSKLECGKNLSELDVEPCPIAIPE